MLIIKKKYLRLVLFSSLLPSFFDGIILVPVALLYQINQIFGRQVLLLLVKGYVCVRLDLDEVG